MLTRLSVLLLSVLAISVLIVGCTQEETPDPLFVGGEADGDGDADGDADGDGDGDGDADTCTGEDYPCGPYGHEACEVMENLSFIAANNSARDLAGGDGILSMQDIFADESIVGFMLFGTAGWCGACEYEADWMNEVYEDFQNVDGRGGRIEFITVVFQDGAANPATAEYAELYGERHNFEFPVVADTQGDVLYYFDAQSTPGNVMVDATEMRINRIIQGFDGAGIAGVLHTLDGDVNCR